LSSVNVSVIMPARNAERFIGEALCSLQQQRGVDLEILVVDDGSTDRTSEIVAEFAAADSRIRIVRTGQRGLLPALNTGLDHVAARYITFLDSDDMCPPGKIERQLGKLAAEPTLGAIVGEVLVFEEALGADLQPLPGSRWARVLSPCLGAGIFRREAVEAIGYFDEHFTHSGDIDFLLRLHDSDWPIQPERELALMCRKHAGNMSANPTEVRLQLLKVLQRSIARRRLSARSESPPPFALMKPLAEIEGSETGLPGHRTADLFKNAGRS
jgi:glycosyltransferase involved in cell wall biosynthesis